MFECCRREIFTKVHILLLYSPLMYPCWNIMLAILNEALPSESLSYQVSLCLRTCLLYGWYPIMGYPVPFHVRKHFIRAFSCSLSFYIMPMNVPISVNLIICVSTQGGWCIGVDLKINIFQLRKHFQLRKELHNTGEWNVNLKNWSPLSVRFL